MRRLSLIVWRWLFRESSQRQMRAGRGLVDASKAPIDGHAKDAPYKNYDCLDGAQIAIARLSLCALYESVLGSLSNLYALLTTLSPYPTCHTRGRLAYCLARKPRGSEHFSK
jgi:hypothetical protein